MALTSELTPLTVITADFNADSEQDKPPLTAHTDTIQAMVLACRDQESLNLMIKGRVDEEAARVSADPMFQAFIKTRAERKSMVHQDTQNPELAQNKLTVEQSADGAPFECTFFDMNKVVAAIFSGRTSANQLMVNFGGITEVEIGSNTATQTELEEAGDILIKEVRARQLGELPVAILATRKTYALG